MRDEIAGGLVAALQPKSAISSCRVNLYLLVTFARMPGYVPQLDDQGARQAEPPGLPPTTR